MNFYWFVNLCLHLSLFLIQEPSFTNNCYQWAHDLFVSRFDDTAQRKYSSFYQLSRQGFNFLVREQCQYAM